MSKSICKSYSHFFSKNTCEIDIVLTRTVNILTTNELVKLMMLWTSGPRYFWLLMFIILPRHAKTCLWAYVDSSAYTVRIEPSFSATRIIGHYSMYQWKANARIRPCACVKWRQICAFCTCSNTTFCLPQPFLYLVADIILIHVICSKIKSL